MSAVLKPESRMEHTATPAPNAASTSLREMARYTAKYYGTSLEASKAAAQMEKVAAEVDELVAALRALLHAFPGEYIEPPMHITRARAALAKVQA